jgi:hypothetical protein
MSAAVATIQTCAARRGTPRVHPASSGDLVAGDERGARNAPHPFAVAQDVRDRHRETAGEEGEPEEDAAARRHPAMPCATCTVNGFVVAAAKPT